jgi:Fe-S-cluster containining protein
MNLPRVRRRLRLVDPVRPANVATAARKGVAAMFADRAPILELADAMLSWHAEAVELRRQETPLEKPLACDAGCSHCCRRLKVTMTQIEAIRLAAHLRSELSEDDLAALRKEVDAAFAAVGGLTAAERAGVDRACPLLDDAGRCRAYAARPLSCRGANAFDASACAKSLADGGKTVVEHDAPQLGIASSIAEGATYATRDARRDFRIVELVAALHVALADPEITKRWSRGERVFEAAVDAEFAGGK